MLSLKIDRKKLLFTGLLMVLLFSCVNVKADASWVMNSNGTYSWYTAKGKLAKNRWIRDNYYVDADGVRVTGRQKIGSKYYFFNKNTGELIRGTWIKSGSRYYYAKKSGVLYRKGRYQIDGYYYYFNKYCRRLTGLRTINGKQYYFDPDNNGRMVTKSWVTIDGKHYYFRKSGAMKKNTWVAKKRYVGSDGAALTGLQLIDGKYYYFDESNRIKVTDTTKTIDGVTYEFNGDGVGTVKTETTSSANNRSYVKGMNNAYYTDPVVSDEVLLSAIMYCEANNQGYEGQLAVGMVIVNRVRSSSFPNTFAQVIYQTGQFTPASGNGGYNILTNTLKNQSVISSSCKKAAAEAIKRYKNGTTTCTVGGQEINFPYLFFCTPSGYASQGLTTSYLTIGGHRFFTKWY